MVSLNLKKQLVWLVTFSVAMGFLESAVVVYLRAIYYKEGFQFPLVAMDTTLAITELLREAATLVMLVGVAVLSAQTAYRRFSFFLIAFAVWDIFYYVFLKLLLDWPASLLTWDILFLLPVPWVGPVLSPCLISLTMIILAGVILDRESRGAISFTYYEWILLFGGSFIVFLSWTLNYFGFHSDTISIEKSVQYFSTYVPQTYNWWLFGLGEVILLSAIMNFYFRNRDRPI